MTSLKISNCAVNYSVFTADNLGPPRVRQFSPPLLAADETPPLPPRHTPTDIQIIDLRAKHVCARQRDAENELELCIAEGE